MESQTEIERKYEVVEGHEVPPLTGLGDLVARGEADLDAEYFDTAEGDLAAHRIVLRRRSGGHDEGWHIKLPAEEGRTELHWPLAEGEAPAEALDVVRVHLRDRPLQLFARIHTHRTILHLVADGGVEVLEIADDRVSASDPATGVVRLWREWEVELLDGAPDSPETRAELLDRVEEQLVAAGATPAKSVSKLASALGRTGLGHPPAPLPGLDRSSALSEVVMRAASALVDDLKELDPAVRREEHDAVHRMRTRARRLRSLLSSYRVVFDADAVDALREELKAFSELLGEARDAEVMLERSMVLIDDHREVAGRAEKKLAGGWRTAHGIAVAALAARMSDTRYFRLLDALDAFVARPPLAGNGMPSDAGAGSSGESEPAAGSGPAEDAVPKILARDLRRVLKTAKAAAAAESEDARVELLHETRKAAKRLRYSAEAVSAGAAAVFGKKVRTLAAAAEAVHDLLGEHRDSVILQQHLLATAGAGDHAFAYGVLFEVERHGAALCLAEYPDALRDLKRLR